MSAKDIRAYIEWRDDRIGVLVDASPEAYVAEVALKNLLAEVEDHITTYPEETHQLAENLAIYNQLKEALDA